MGLDHIISEEKETFTAPRDGAGHVRAGDDALTTGPDDIRMHRITRGKTSGSGESMKVIISPTSIQADIKSILRATTRTRCDVESILEGIDRINTRSARSETKEGSSQAVTMATEVHQVVQEATTDKVETAMKTWLHTADRVEAAMKTLASRQDTIEESIVRFFTVQEVAMDELVETTRKLERKQSEIEGSIRTRMDILENRLTCLHENRGVTIDALTLKARPGKVTARNVGVVEEDQGGHRQVQKTYRHRHLQEEG